MDIHDLKDFITSKLADHQRTIKKYCIILLLFIVCFSLVNLHIWWTTNTNKIRIKNDIFEYQSDSQYQSTHNFQHTKEQEKRLQTLRDYCKSKLPLTIKNEMFNFKHSSPSYKANIYLSHKQNTIYCGAPKVASTNWKKMFLLFENKIESVADIKIKSQVHSTKLERLFSIIGQGHINHFLKKYYKFLFVRHPFERIVSAYRNKFNDNNTFFEKTYGTRILRLERKNMTEKEYKTGKGVTFYEFLSWLIKKKVYDPHWIPIYNICSPCILPYDFIGKLETLKEDTSRVLTDLKSEHLFPIENSDGYRESSHELMLKYFSKLKYSTIKTVYELYEADFLAFGYEIPKELLPTNKH